jgi:leader peptidase (prepilin peptidase)/N-methyltransferase
MLIYLWLFLAFVVGLIVGSFLNVCVARLPLEKSLFWPGSRCGNCLQSVRWYDNIPLVSYLVLRGRCRTCGASFSVRYFLVELLTALGFAALFYLECVENIHRWPAHMPPWQREAGLVPWQWVAGFAFHALLFSFLMVAAFCDLDGREIPLSLTLTGTFVGLLGAMLMPWPWPDTWGAIQERLRAENFRYPQMLEGDWKFLRFPVPPGLYPWPAWGPLPGGLAPGSWQLGLVNGLAGMLVGTFLLRGMRFLFSAGLGKEALGLGDADLMMMAGAFLGWQPIVVAVFVAVIPALFFGIIQVAVHRDNSLPFGPSLAAGVLLTMLLWRWLGRELYPLFFWRGLMLWLVVLGGAFMFGSSLLLRLARRGEEKGAV